MLSGRADFKGYAASIEPSCEGGCRIWNAADTASDEPLQSSPPVKEGAGSAGSSPQESSLARLQSSPPVKEGAGAWFDGA